VSTDGADASASTWAPLRSGVFRGLFHRRADVEHRDLDANRWGAVVLGERKASPTVIALFDDPIHRPTRNVDLVHAMPSGV
jgi:hypothetical protein